MDPAQTFLLSVPGTEQTRELTRDGLLRELVTGQITPDHWVWSPADSDWKQISQLPELLAPPPQPAPVTKPTTTPAPIPKQTLSTPAPISKITVNPAPLPAAQPAPVSKITVNPAPIARTFVPTSKTAAAPPVAPMAAAAAAPALFNAKTPAPSPKPLPSVTSPPSGPRDTPGLVPGKMEPIAKTTVHKNAPAPPKKRVVRPRRDPKVHEEGLSYTKISFGVLYVAVAAIIGANYFLVDKKMDETLAHTPFVLVPAHAHLGSFVQPNALVIHVLPNAELTNDNLADYLQTLAKSTPGRPFMEDKPFGMVALTSAWFSEYAFTGADWQALGKMKDASSDDRRDFITDHLCTIAGQPLIHHTATQGLVDLKAQRTHVWQDLTTHFVQGHA